VNVSMLPISREETRVSVTALRRRLARLRVVGAGPDSGVSLIEVMVAMLIFAIVSSGVIATLSLSVKETRDGRNRVQAAQLAARELEIARNQFTSTAAGGGPDSLALNAVRNPSPLAVGGTVGRPLVVDKTAYTVVRTARWTGSASGAGVSPCDSGATDRLVYLHVRVEVTWGQMGDTPPVVSDTILTPRSGAQTGTATGHIAVKVVNAAGGPQGGVTVGISAPGVAKTGVTASDGCAVFGFLTPGNYTTSVSATGLPDVYVDQGGATTATTTIGVTAGNLLKHTFSYDRAAVLSFTYESPATGHSVPAGLDGMTIRLSGSNLQPNGVATFPGSGTPRVIANLFPSTAGYSYAFGTCTSNVAAGTAAATPGTTKSVGYRPTALTLDVVHDSDGAAYSGVQVVAVGVTDTGCATAPTFALGTTGADGRLLTSLPPGTWSLQVAGKSGGANTTPVDGQKWPQRTVGTSAASYTIRAV
jgi:prepilin-type N-terminal cleavage/methylation domain-containing protein